MSRHTARIHALNMVFQLPFHMEREKPEIEEAVEYYLQILPEFKGLLKGISPDEEEKDFIKDEIIGTFTHLKDIDILIDGYLKNWDLERIAKIDLAILRLALYEIKHAAGVSTGTAINEAVELAKIYGTDDSYAFINGVLGRVDRSG